jgi:hypothetical protein
MNNALHNHSCPALMSDARFATDYRPSCEVIQLINMQNGIRNSTQQRLFLTRNATQLMDLNAQYFNAKAGCNYPYYLVDPNRHNAYWSKYKSYLARFN